jgi:hypothetical protein
VSVDYLTLPQAESERNIPWVRTARTAKTPHSDFLQFVQFTIGEQRCEESQTVPGRHDASRFAELPPCQQCRNLGIPDRDGFRRCLAAARGELPYVASRNYSPVLWLGRRCGGFLPTLTDPDQRPGREHWPGLTERGATQ